MIRVGTRVLWRDGLVHVVREVAGDRLIPAAGRLYKLHCVGHWFEDDDGNGVDNPPTCFRCVAAGGR